MKQNPNIKKISNSTHVCLADLDQHMMASFVSSIPTGGKVFLAADPIVPYRHGLLKRPLTEVCFMHYFTF